MDKVVGLQMVRIKSSINPSATIDVIFFHQSCFHFDFFRFPMSVNHLSGTFDK